MRFPLALTAKIARHIIRHKLARTPKFAMVLQLEPLHTCNLTCTGCGRIREYCTNGMFMRKKMRDYMARAYSPALEPQLVQLLKEKLISDHEAGTIRQGNRTDRPVITPTRWMYWNVHIDGLEYTHDLIVEREGVFKECVEAIRMAKILG